MRAPVVVVFCASQDGRSGDLATPARRLALEFGDVITFYGYRAAPGARVEPRALAALRQRYGVRQVPATLCYDNDRGEIGLERAGCSAPTLIEDRTPEPPLLPDAP